MDDGDSLNIFQASARIMDAQVVKFEVFRKNVPLSYNDVLTLWQVNPDFQMWFTQILSACKFEAFRWETPALTRVSAEAPFQCVLVNAPSFAKRKTDKMAFRKYFSDDLISAFPNLGGDSLMIVPSPKTDADIYGHFSAFLRGASKKQIQALWHSIGFEVSSRISDTPLWLSTAGGGVAWLHVRLDSRPKYYHFAPFRHV